jgi:hypothetical protein
VRDLVAAHAMARKGMNEEKIPIDQTYVNKSLRRAQVFQINKDVKEE